jgi:hypothetical protein
MDKYEWPVLLKRIKIFILENENRNNPERKDVDVEETELTGGELLIGVNEREHSAFDIA